MSTGSLQTETPPPSLAPTAPTKRVCRSDDEIGQALRATGGKIPAAAAALGMSYHAVYHRVHKRPRLLQRWASPKVRRALVATIPKDLFARQKSSANAGRAGDSQAGALRERRLMMQGRADDGAAFLPALALCRCGPVTAYRLIREQLDWITGELRGLEALARAGRGDFGREVRLRKQQMKLFDRLIEFGKTTRALESRCEAENRVSGAAAA